MDRIAGIETEYGCLVEPPPQNPLHADAWPARVKTTVFRQLRMGAIDQHYRDYEEPPGNGGFLRNGGRIYMDMGHLEYASPECRSVRDLVRADLAGDEILRTAVAALGAGENVAFLKNNIDHHTGATFGCHENYSMSRLTTFTSSALQTLLCFLATRQIFTGAGRVGQAISPAFGGQLEPTEVVDFQLSQRADYIVNDVYQWVQFNRSIINARDEPLADASRFRRLHLLIGDSNMSPVACALKVGLTALVLTLLEEDALPGGAMLADAVESTQAISRGGDGLTRVLLTNGENARSHHAPAPFLKQARKHLGGRDEETDWLLGLWEHVLVALETKPESLLGGVDWISKKWLLEMFRENEGLSWQDPWLQSIDLEYHHLDRAKGLFFAVEATDPIIRDFNAEMLGTISVAEAPGDTRAAARGLAVEHFIEAGGDYLVNWDSVSVPEPKFVSFEMPDPLADYRAGLREFLAGLG